MSTLLDSFAAYDTIRMFASKVRMKEQRLFDLQAMAAEEKFFATASVADAQDDRTILIPTKLVHEYIQIESVQLERELAKLRMKFHDILKILEGD